MDDSETVLGHSALKEHKTVTQRPKEWGVRQRGRERKKILMSEWEARGEPSAPGEAFCLSGEQEDRATTSRRIKGKRGLQAKGGALFTKEASLRGRQG